MAEPSFEAIERGLKKAVAALRDAQVDFLLGGSLASWARGGPETRHDLDLIVKPEQAGRALEALAQKGMRPARTAGGGLAQQGLIERGEDLSVFGVTVPVMAIEDVLATKLFALTEHRLDYSGLLEVARALREQIDWRALQARTRGSPYAAAFFVLVQELGLVPEQQHPAHGAEVRVIAPPA